jgi:predicted dehydrogenase
MLKQGRFPTEAGWGAEPESGWGILNLYKEGKDYRAKYPTLPGNYLAYYQNIYERLVEGKPLEVNAEQALHVIEIIEACIQSSMEKRVLLLH